MRAMEFISHRDADYAEKIARFARRAEPLEDVSAVVAEVVSAVRARGDEALLELVKKFDGTEIRGDEATQETQIGEYVEAGLAGTAPFDTPKKHIVIRGEKGVKHGEISRVTKAIGKVVSEEIPVLFIAVLESN